MDKRRKLPTTLTADRLRKALSYDPETGIFIRLVGTRGHAAGFPVGNKNAFGYMRTQVGGEFHFLHRLAWLYMTGEYPNHTIDHMDGWRTNNAWSNLRDVTLQVNIQNKRKANKRSQSGVLGISPSSENNGRWRASIGLGKGKVRQLGTFESAAEAHSAYLSAKRRLHEGCTI